MIFLVLFLTLQSFLRNMVEAYHLSQSIVRKQVLDRLSPFIDVEARLELVLLLVQMGKFELSGPYTAFINVRIASTHIERGVIIDNSLASRAFFL